MRRLQATGANRPGSPLSVRVYPGVGHSLANGNTFHPDFVRDLQAFLAERAR